ncbi:sensor histidine kinase [Pseudonocardia acaciae]|uniref:sensor histidine kinase n=1 Tax=Pseudonocardia acaciae TaxID=551276 RepID=UPI00048CBD05|nr:HAMP domain-containing sensor histidine kinase [Pseudonocardia acaciae]
MRRRLIAVLLAFAAVAVAGFAWPLLVSAAAERTGRLLIDRTAALDRFAVLAQQAAAGGDASALTEDATAYARLYGEGVMVIDQRRRPLVTAGDLRPDDPALKPLIDGALRNEPGQPLPQLRPWSSEDVVLTRPVGTGIRITGVVALRVSVAQAAADVARSWTLILLGALTAAAGFVALALLLARWVLRPLAGLERGVLAMTAGHQGTHVPRLGGPPELRALAESFNHMSDALAAASRREHQLVADASHQLRNPMAALRLRLDSLAPRIAPDAETGYRSLATEVARLESLLDGLLALATADRAADRATLGTADADADDQPWCLPSPVAAATVEAWRPAAANANVWLICDVPDELSPVACPRSELAQVLDVLLDNAIRYIGPGATATLRGIEDAHAVRLRVEDDGPGLSAEERQRATQRFWRANRHDNGSGTGLGLAIADQMLTARSGTLKIEPNDPAGLVVTATLPRSDPEEP